MTAASAGPACSGWRWYDPDSPCSCSERSPPGPTAPSHQHPPGNIWIHIQHRYFRCRVPRHLPGIYRLMHTDPNSSCISATMSNKICRRCHLIRLHSLWKSKATYLQKSIYQNIEWPWGGVRHMWGVRDGAGGSLTWSCRYPSQSPSCQMPAPEAFLSPFGWSVKKRTSRSVLSKNHANNHKWVFVIDMVLFPLTASF